MTDIIARLIELVYAFHGAGGDLHIVLDDGNIENSNITFCLEEIDKKNQRRGLISFELIELAVAYLLLSVPVEDRQKAIDLYWDRVKEQKKDYNEKTIKLGWKWIGNLHDNED